MNETIQERLEREYNEKQLYNIIQTAKRRRLIPSNPVHIELQMEDWEREEEKHYQWYRLNHPEEFDD